jgi:hypothetical protein
LGVGRFSEVVDCPRPRRAADCRTADSKVSGWGYQLQHSINILGYCVGGLEAGAPCTLYRFQSMPWWAIGCEMKYLQEETVKESIVGRWMSFQWVGSW